MALLVTVITGGLAQVFIFLLRWSIAVTAILSRGLSCIDPNCRVRALRLGVTGAAITTIPIAPTFLVVPARSLGVVGLGAMKRHGLCLLETERKRTLVPKVFFGRF